MDDGIQKLIMSIVGIAVLLVVSLLILGQIKDSVGDTIDSTSVANETVSWTNGSVSTVANTGFAMICNAIYNDTANTVLIAAGNYTCGATGTIDYVDNGGIQSSTAIYVHYGYKIGDSAYNSTGANVTNLSKIPTWIGILITIALAFIVLGYFYSRNN